MNTRAVVRKKGAFDGLKDRLAVIVERIRVHAPDFNLESVPRENRKVLDALVSAKACRARDTDGLWAPFSGPWVRRMCRLAGIERPGIEDLSHIHALWTGAACGSGLLNEYIARRTRANRLKHHAWTKTVDGVTQLLISSKEQKASSKLQPVPGALKGVLPETWGLVLFDDQVYAVGSRIAGFSKAQAKRFFHSIQRGSQEAAAIRWEKKFLRAGRTKGYSAAQVDEVLRSLRRSKYAQTRDRAHTHEYIQYAYLHAYCWLEYPREYYGAYRKTGGPCSVV